MIDKNILREYGIKANSYQKKGSVVIVKSNDRAYVLKPRKVDKKSIFNYLESRNFNFFPKVYNIDNDSNYDLFEYIINYDIPDYDKAKDIMRLMSLLHYKTTHYKDFVLDDIKIIYEDIYKKIEDLSFYYDELFDELEKEIYMSPYAYLLIRNSSKIRNLLNFCKDELDSWYDIISKKDKYRFCLIHNNLSLEHILSCDKSYLISFDKAKEDMPIYDLVSFYLKDGKRFDFKELLEVYEEHYQLFIEEKKLLFVLVSLPCKIDFNDNDAYLNTLKVKNLLDDIYKTDKFISPYYTNNEKD